MSPLPIQDGPLHPVEGSAAVVPASAPPLAILLSRHICRDGEVVLLVLKPSLWFVPLSSLRFAATALIMMIGCHLLSDRIPFHRLLMEAALLLIAGRIMWAAMQWMGRLYVLTDQRIMRLEGVFQTAIFDCPLRKVNRTRMLQAVREKILNLGTIEIIPKDESMPITSWQMVARPARVHDQVVAAINRAKQGGEC